MIDLDELERKAKAATPGPWEVSCDSPHIIVCNDRTIMTGGSASDCAFASEFNPSVAQELILRLREAEQDRKRIDWLADPNNNIGNVQLPTECVLNNLHSLRAAIDAAMTYGK